MKNIIFVLHNIRSALNVGSIFRTADALNVEKIYLCGITPTPEKVKKAWSFHTKKEIEKTALGSEKTVPWEYSFSTLKTIKKLKKEGVEILGLEITRKSIPYFQFTPKKRKIALIVGHEKKGVPFRILKECHKILYIPMEGKKESLNVAIALSVVAFHLNLKLRGL